MALPTISDIARVTRDCELRYTQQGTAVLSVGLAFNRPKFNEQTREWENDRTFFIDATIWKDAAERASNELSKGVEVYVTGELETQQWEKDGEKRSKPALQVRRFKVIPKSGAQQQGGGFNSGQSQQQSYGQSQPAQQSYGQPPQGDPWGGGGNQGGGVADDFSQPPF